MVLPRLQMKVPLQCRRMQNSSQGTKAANLVENTATQQVRSCSRHEGSSKGRESIHYILGVVKLLSRGSAAPKKKSCSKRLEMLQQGVSCKASTAILVHRSVMRGSTGAPRNTMLLCVR